MEKRKQQAFILRLSPCGIDRVEEALDSNQIFVGWPEARGLLSEDLSWEEFRDIVSKAYYSSEKNLRKAGMAAGHLWRFIREMRKGDLVVVPHGSELYVAEIEGPAEYDESKVEDDTAYRCKVTWLNGGKPMPRTLARSALIARMKTHGTSASATDLLPQIKECLELTKRGAEPTFPSDLEKRLVEATLEEIRSGRMDNRKFEELVRRVLMGLGADEARIIPTKHDKGADIIARFKIAGVFSQTLAVQVKYWKPEGSVGKGVVKQLIRGIEAAGDVNLGMIVTSGTISDDAMDEAEWYFEDRGIKIELVDGEQLAKLIIEHGIKVCE